MTTIYKEEMFERLYDYLSNYDKFEPVTYEGFLALPETKILMSHYDDDPYYAALGILHDAGKFNKEDIVNPSRYTDEVKMTKEVLEAALKDALVKMFSVAAMKEIDMAVFEQSIDELFAVWQGDMIEYDGELSTGTLALRVIIIKN